MHVAHSHSLNASTLGVETYATLMQLDIKEFLETLINQIKEGHTMYIHALLHTQTASMPQHFHVETYAPLMQLDIKEFL